MWAQQFFSLAFQYGCGTCAGGTIHETDMKEIRTKADEKRDRGRPYVYDARIHARVIGWKSKVEKGEEGKLFSLDVAYNKRSSLLMVMISGQKKVEQIRHIMPRRVEIYRRSEGTNGRICLGRFMSHGIPAVMIFLGNNCTRRKQDLCVVHRHCLILAC